ncbi:MAG: hypothetical protein KC609_03665 [Myxococcales bacterium]|nr:hypothetical protein [Myxococcales bacterium]
MVLGVFAVALLIALGLWLARRARESAPENVIATSDREAGEERPPDLETAHGLFVSAIALVRERAAVQLPASLTGREMVRTVSVAPPLTEPLRLLLRHAESEVFARRPTSVEQLTACRGAHREIAQWAAALEPQPRGTRMESGGAT